MITAAIASLGIHAPGLLCSALAALALLALLTLLTLLALLTLFSLLALRSLTVAARLVSLAARLREPLLALLQPAAQFFRTGQRALHTPVAAFA